MSSTLPAIEILEERLRRAMLDGDVATLDELIAPELMFVSPDGHVVDKSTDIEAHRSSALKIARLDVSDRRVQEWDNCVVVSVQAELEGTYGGQPFAGSFRYTRIWIKRENRWRIVAGHASPVVN